MMRVRVEGENKLQAAFRLFGKDIRSLSSAWARISKALSAAGKAEAVGMFANATGALAASIRAGRQKKYASATAGGRGIVYAAVQHWASGWPGPNPKEVPFMFEAREKTMPGAVKTVAAELSRAAKRAGL